MIRGETSLVHLITDHEQPDSIESSIFAYQLCTLLPKDFSEQYLKIAVVADIEPKQKEHSMTVNAHHYRISSVIRRNDFPSKTIPKI